MNDPADPNGATAPYPVPKPPQRGGRRLLAALALLLVLAAYVGLGYVTYQNGQRNDALARTLGHTRATATGVMRQQQGVMRQQQAALALTRGRLQTATSGESIARATGVAGATAAAGVAAQATADAATVEANASPTNTPTPSTPFLQTCFQEDGVSGSACQASTSSFYQDAFSDIQIAFVVPNPHSFRSSAVTWRLFRQDTNGNVHPDGSYYDASLDPQNPGFTWQVSALFANVNSQEYPYRSATPQPGKYKVELLDQNQNFIAATTITILATSFGSGNANATPTDTAIPGA